MLLRFQACLFHPQNDKTKIFFLHLLGLARDQFLKELKESCDTELQYLVKCRDRSISPRRPDYNRLYNEYCREKYGDRNGVGMFSHLSEVIESFQSENPDTVVAFQPYEESYEGKEKVVTPFILVMITDLMKRVHEMVSDMGRS